MAQKLLVVRNDKIGDFMLAWPALACLKSAQPTPHITVLVPAYTAPLAHACPWVDEVLIDPSDNADKAAQQTLLNQIKAESFDALLTLFSTPRIGWLGWRAGIPLRVAPATKWAQIFYNVRIRQRRSRSSKPEYQYNVDLACELLSRLTLALPAQPSPAFWPLSDRCVEQQRQKLLKVCQIMTGDIVVVHPGSGGSAVNLSIEQYSTLIYNINQSIRDTKPINWLISSGPNEVASAQALIDQLLARHIVAQHLPTTDNVADFALQLAGVDMLIAGSTGPLHIAGCLNLATAGFYPAKRSATPLRWQTCNDVEKRLAFSPPASVGQQDMAAIDINAAAQKISAYLSG